MTSNTPRRRDLSSFGRHAPYLTVFTSSFCIMILQLVAGRLISRHIGQSLYTWTTIIGVVLAGIALGNGVGGRIADRWWGRGVLALQLFSAAAGCLVVLWLNSAAGALISSSSMSWPARIFLHITIVFLLPSALLGTISPVIARRALMQGLATGRTMGNVYAWAIGGSIAGTFVTGYVLVMWLPVTLIVLGASFTLALLGGAYAVGAWMQTDAGPRASWPGERSGAGDFRLVRIWGILLAVFLANASLMAMEIVAGRLTARFYGQSLYSWTSVIGLILAGLTFGSYVGGRMADRAGVDRLLSKIFSACSVLCVSIPLLTIVVARAAPLRMLYWPHQIAAYVALVFFMPAALLGATSPVLARMALFRTSGTGRTVGVVYASGALGSIAGTFLAGYYLIGAAGSMRTLALLGLLLAVMAAVYDSRFSFSHMWALCCVLLTLGAFLPSLPVAGGVSAAMMLNPVAPANAVYVNETQYAYVTVTADRTNPRVRQMNMDQLVHSKVDLDNPLYLEYEYMHLYEAAIDARFAAGAPVSALNIGGGGYVFPRYLELTRPGSHIEVAEIDPQVTEAAHDAFGLPRGTSVRAFNMDARNRVADLARMKTAGEDVRLFDCILGDSFNDYNVPYHLTTREFNEQLRELMSDSGIYALNIIDVMDSGMFLGAVVKTCRDVFPYVYVFGTSDRNHERQTFVVVNALEPLDAERIPATVAERYGYHGRLLDAELEPLVASAPLLTDDFAPVENLLAAVVQYSQETATDMLLQSARESFARGRTRQAVRRARRALALTPGSTEAFDVLIDIHIETGNYDQAIRVGRQAVEKHPNNTPLLISLGGAYLMSGQPELALEPLSAAIERDPTSKAAHGNIASAYFDSGNYNLAIEHLNRVLELNPRAENVQQQLAVIYFNLEDYDRAWEAVGKAIENREQVDPAFLDALTRDSGRAQTQTN